MPLFVPLLMNVSVCGKLRGRYSSWNTMTDQIPLKDTILQVLAEMQQISPEGEERRWFLDERFNFESYDLCQQIYESLCDLARSGYVGLKPSELCHWQQTHDPAPQISLPGDTRNLLLTAILVRQ
jgi:hypothetical protein